LKLPFGDLRKRDQGVAIGKFQKNGLKGPGQRIGEESRELGEGGKTSSGERS